MVGVSRRPFILYHCYEAGPNARINLFALLSVPTPSARSWSARGPFQHDLTSTRLAQDDRQGFVDAIGRSDRALDTLTRHGSERGTVRRHGLPV